MQHFANAPNIALWAEVQNCVTKFSHIYDVLYCVSQLLSWVRAYGRTDLGSYSAPVSYIVPMYFECECVCVYECGTGAA